MASRKKVTLTGIDADIEKLQKQLAQKRAERKKYEDEKKKEIGQYYFELMLLDDETLDVEQVAADLKRQLKVKQTAQQNNSKSEQKPHEQAHSY